MAGFAKTHRPAQNRGPGESRFTCFHHDRFVEWTVFMSITLANEDSKKERVFRKIHGLTRNKGEADYSTSPNSKETAENGEAGIEPGFQPIAFLNEVEGL